MVNVMSRLSPEHESMLSSPKPDDKDGKGYSKEIVQHEQKHRDEIFSNNYLSKIGSLE